MFAHLIWFSGWLDVADCGSGDERTLDDLSLLSSFLWFYFINAHFQNCIHSPFLFIKIIHQNVLEKDYWGKAEGLLRKYFVFSLQVIGYLNQSKSTL